MAVRRQRTTDYLSIQQKSRQPWDNCSSRTG